VAALNRGIEHCRGEYIARMDVDDISENIRLEYLNRYLDLNPDVYVLGSGMKEFGNHEGIVNTFHSHELIKTQQVFDGGIHHPTAIFRKSVFFNRKYKSDYPHMEDYDLFYELGKHYKMHCLSNVLYRYRIHEKAVTKENIDSLEKRIKPMHLMVLSDLGFNPDDATLKIHFKLWRGELDRSELLRAIDWIVALKNALREKQNIPIHISSEVLYFFLDKSIFRLIDLHGFEIFFKLLSMSKFDIRHLRYALSKSLRGV
jgi:glycosyltransferase involved in cell wall biosynthesis